jgi:hypothetical protein
MRYYGVVFRPFDSHGIGPGGTPVTLSDYNTAFYTLAFVVPGFVLHSTMSICLPKREEGAELSFLRFLTLSCLNYAVWTWLIYLLLNTEFFTLHPWRAASAWFAIIFLSPVAIGLLLAFLQEKDIPRKWLQRWGLRPVHPIPTAWDYVFRKVEDCVWALVTLKDGRQVAGLFATQSFASSAPAERDLYLEKVFVWDASEPWKPVPRSDGILIRGDEIRHVEFWTDKKE